MAERLYGVDPLLDGLVPGLVGLDRDGGRRDLVELPDEHPVIELVGGRCSGRTRVLATLSAAYPPSSRSCAWTSPHPFAQMLRMANAYPDAFVRIVDAGHELPVEKPARLTALTGQFVSVSAA